MTSLIIALGVVLILAILYMIFRVSNLISIAKGPRDEKGGTENKVNAALFIVFMIVSFVGFFWYSFAYFEDYNSRWLPNTENGLIRFSGLRWRLQW